MEQRRTAVGPPRRVNISAYEDGATSAMFRLRVEDGKAERLALVTSIKFASNSLGWVGFTPDGSLIVTRDVGSTETYALDWSAP